jgi:hypothetical protein
MTRSFAYFGIPPLFIGEIVLGAFVLLKPRVALGTWVTSLLRPSPLNGLGFALLIFMLYGVFQVGRGVLGGNSVVHTFKFFIFNYYTIYLFMGIWIGLQAPEFLPKLVRVLAWVHGLYSLIWLMALRHVEASMPGSEMALFGLPAGGAVAVLGLLCFERNLRAVWPVLALNMMAVMAMQARATWLGLGLGVLVWGLLTRRFGRVVALGVAGLAVLGMIELAGIRWGTEGRAMSPSREVLSIAIAPIDMELAKELSPRAIKKANTAEWRHKWWDQIWLAVHSDPMFEAFGLGYGFDLFALAPEDVRAGQAEEIRTPHSVFYYALGYTGWVGVVLFAILQFAILRLLWRSFRFTGQPAGVVFWVMGMAMASFEAGFDTPYKAIPFYLLVGMAMAPGLQAKGGEDARPARAQLLSVAGR